MLEESEKISYSHLDAVSIDDLGDDLNEADALLILEAFEQAYNEAKKDVGRQAFREYIIAIINEHEEEQTPPFYQRLIDSFFGDVPGGDTIIFFKDEILKLFRRFWN